MSKDYARGFLQGQMALLNVLKENGLKRLDDLNNLRKKACQSGIVTSSELYQEIEYKIKGQSYELGCYNDLILLAEKRMQEMGIDDFKVPLFCIGCKHSLKGLLPKDERTPGETL